MSKRTSLFILPILALAVALFHFGIKKRPTEKNLESLTPSSTKALKWIGKVPPDFELILLSGEKFVLSENIGKKIIVLNFFTTWCEPCKQEIPEFRRFYESHKKESFIMIGIDCKEKEEDARKFVAEQKIGFNVGLDEDGSLMKKYGVGGYPSTICIGADGKILFYQTGPLSNAAIAFAPFYQSNLQMLDEKKGIDKNTFLTMLAEQEKSGFPEKKKEVAPKLEGRALEFAKKMNCPSCGHPLVSCNEKAAMNIKKQLSEMKLENKTDEEILKELFLSGSEKK